MILYCFPLTKFKTVTFQTPKHIQDIFDFNITSNSCGYLALFVPKTLSVVWYFIIDLIPSKFCSYFALFGSKSAVIFIYFYHLIIFKLHKFTWTLCGVFLSSSLNSYIIFYYWNTHLEIHLTTSFVILLFKTGDYFVIASLIID